MISEQTVCLKQILSPLPLHTATTLDPAVEKVLRTATTPSLQREELLDQWIFRLLPTSTADAKLRHSAITSTLEAEAHTIVRRAVMQSSVCGIDLGPAIDARE